MSTGAVSKEPLPLTPDQKEIVGQLSSATQIVAAMLLLLGVVYIVTGPLSWWSFGAGLFAALLTLVQGLLTAFLGLVMLAASSDFKFLGQFPQFTGNHLRNAAKNLTVFHKALVGLAVIMALVAMVRLLA